MLSDIALHNSQNLTVEFLKFPVARSMHILSSRSGAVFEEVLITSCGCVSFVLQSFMCDLTKLHIQHACCAAQATFSVCAQKCGKQLSTVNKE